MLTDKSLEPNSEDQNDLKRKRIRNLTNINNVIEYITRKKYPADCDKLTKRSIRRSARQNFKIEAGSLLYRSFIKKSKTSTFTVDDTKTETDTSTGTAAVNKKVRQCDENWRKVVMTQAEKQDVLHNSHSSCPGGHCGRDKTINKIQKFFWWPGLVRDVKDYIRSCPGCKTTIAKAKMTREPVESPTPISIDLPICWNMVGIDLLEMAEVTDRGNKYICVVTCNYTKWAEAKALASNDITPVSVFLKEIFLRYGFPNVLLSEQGCEYCNKLARKVSRLLKHHQFKTTVYHPQTGDLAGRFNVALDKILQALDGTDWDNRLDSCLFEYRTSVHEDTKFSPFYLMYAREPLIPDVEQDESMMTEHLKDESAMYKDKTDQLMQVSDGNDNNMPSIEMKSEHISRNIPELQEVEATGRAGISSTDVNGEFSVEVDGFVAGGDPRPHHELAMADYLQLGPSRSVTASTGQTHQPHRMMYDYKPGYPHPAGQLL